MVAEMFDGLYFNNTANGMNGNYAFCRIQYFHSKKRSSRANEKKREKCRISNGCRGAIFAKRPYIFRPFYGLDIFKPKRLAMRENS